jgi:hypothetical protein
MENCIVHIHTPEEANLSDTSPSSSLKDLLSRPTEFVVGYGRPLCLCHLGTSRPEAPPLSLL